VIDALLEIHKSALAGMRSLPSQFERWSKLAAENFPGADLSEEAFLSRLTESTSRGNSLKAQWKMSLTSWDFEENPAWPTTTLPRTDERRAEIYSRLRFSGRLCKALDLEVPVAKLPGATVIATQHDPWYTSARATDRTFYWDAYRQKLRSKNWSESAIASLDEASHAVVERLTDPEQLPVRQAKGLVVGYVQSGKTANFTGVTAKAIDAGYRLVIILGGSLNLLRAQTQRRLDMELIGQENILRGADPTDVDTLIGIDYLGDDEEWPEFVQHGGRPSSLGAFDIERLTTRESDYQSLAQGIKALEFEKREPTLPLNNPENLHYAAARVMVVKKNKHVLTKLVKDLKQIHGILGELPALIIDDESDQASVNTSNPKKWAEGATERTAINGLISQLLKLLPRAQYVGYTATPFANVFVDPGDSQDIFPTDFLISLPRPQGYMGVQSFHDLDSILEPEERTFANSQEKAHVRDVYDGADDRLQEAMDAFVVAGAIKLFRTAHGVPSEAFRHHTMLVHQSVKTNDHTELALRINSMWHRAGYASSEGHSRLAALWAKDFAEVSAARAGDLPNPTSYDELRPHVSRARQLISQGGEPVVVVNGDTDRYFAQLDLDFVRTPNVWKILVGGTKLSRGFTVEGLTVTYYRRTTRQGDTLMQMGRWFGFRPGYRDLVRLYIGRNEKLMKTMSVDLYKAFEAVCRDEELFREQLSQYSVLIDGRPQVVPDEVPPLVAQHLPWIKPSAKNKMYNAQLVEIRSPGKPIEPAAYPTDQVVLRRNTERWRPLLDRFSQDPVTFSTVSGGQGSVRTFPALTGQVEHAELLGVLSSLEWERADLFEPHLAYLCQLDGTVALVDDWLLIAPQLLQNGTKASILGSAPFSLVRRTRQTTSSFGRIAGVEHRLVGQGLIDAAGNATAATNAAGVPTVGPTTGVVLLYPVVDAKDDAQLQASISRGKADPAKLVMAFTLIPPNSAVDSTRRLLRYKAKDSRR
jgi:hypothetical protein